MNANLMNLLSPLSRLIAGSKVFASIYKFLPNYFKTYDCIFQPTFSHTNGQKIVGISSVAWEIGWLREVYGLNMLPGFKDNVANNFNRYVLKTVSSSFAYGKMSFGEKVKVKVSVGELNEAEGRFSLFFHFYVAGKVVSTEVQQIYYVATGKTNQFIEKERFFRLIKSLSTQASAGFSINNKMKTFVTLKSRSDFDYEYNFCWDLRTTTEEGNTNHASFVEILHSALEHRLVHLDPGNGELIKNGQLMVKTLEVCYIKDFHLFENSKIRFFPGKDGIIQAIFIRDDGIGGAALASIKLQQ